MTAHGQFVGGFIFTRVPLARVTLGILLLEAVHGVGGGGQAVLQQGVVGLVHTDPHRRTPAAAEGLLQGSLAVVGRHRL